MASHSTRATQTRGLADGKPVDSGARGSPDRRAEENGPERPRASARAHARDGESKDQTPAPVPASCFVYILSCSDGTFYVGSTSDLRERERIHNEGHAAEYTASRRPVRVVYSEPHEYWPAARKREAQ